MLPYPDDEKLAQAKIPSGGLNLPVISEIKEIEWFEGVRPFAVGLRAKKTLPRPAIYKSDSSGDRFQTIS